MTWTDRAACKGADINLFYPPRGGPVPPEAYAMCAACPVRAECEAEADHFGMWAGKSPTDRGVRGGLAGRSHLRTGWGVDVRVCRVCGRRFWAGPNAKVCDRCDLAATA